MSRPRSKIGVPNRAAGLTFLLSQVGAHYSARFAERLQPLGFKPMHAGILRIMGQVDGLSQQALGEKLGVFPSRLVSVIDELEGLGLVERRDSPTDRRSYALYLTGAGYKAIEKIDTVSQELQGSVCAALDETERAQLAGFLQRIVAEQGLAPGVHPGFRNLGGE